MRRSKNHQLLARLCIGLAFLALVAAAAPASASKLVGTTGKGGAPSTLLEIDPLTGATLGVIGPVGYAVNGMEYDPATGKLYGSTSMRDPSHNGLIEIDLTTGAGTPIGPSGWGGIPGVFNNGFATPVTNITIDSSGQMYGWYDPAADDLVRIDKTTGIATWVGDAGLNTRQYGLDFDNSDTLYLIQTLGGSFPAGVYAVDVTTGVAASIGTYPTTGNEIHHGDFDPATNLYYGIGPDAGSPRYPDGPKFLEVVDVSTLSVVATAPLDDEIHVLTFVCDVPAPIAWWKFDEGSGLDAFDSSPNGNDGKLKSYPRSGFSGAGVPVWTAGHTSAPGDWALEFDGSNGYVDAGSDATLDNLSSFTYAAWVQRAADGDLEIFSKRNSWHEMRFKGAGVLRGCLVANLANACSDSAETVPLDTWTHVAMTYDHAGDKKVHLYINGAEVTYASQSTAKGQVKPDASSRQNLGRRQNRTRYYWGVLDEMMIFDEALTACAIAQLAERCPAGLLGSTAGNGALIDIDPSTGAGTFRAPHGSFGSVTEIEIRPDGVLFGSTGGGSSHIITLDPVTGAETLVGTHVFGAINGMEFVGSTLYGAYIPFSNFPSDLVTVDQGTGALTIIGPTGFSNMGGLAYDPISATMYASEAGGALGSRLFTIDLATGAATPVGPVGFDDISALEFGPGGLLYAGVGGGGGDPNAGSLITIDTTTGAGTLVGPTGFARLSGLACSPSY